MKKLIEENKRLRKILKIEGITLITLIVTIVILLMLAGIVIMQLNNKGLLKNTKIAKEKFTNSQKEENSVIDDYSNQIDVATTREETITINKADYDSIINRLSNLENNNNVTETKLVDITSGITLTKNIIRKVGKVVYINIRGYYSSNIPTSYDFNIGKVPNGYLPSENFISNIDLSNNEWNVNALGYLFIDSSGVLIRNFNSTNYKYFFICESYIIK